MKIILLRSGLLIALTFIGVGDAFSSDMKACPDSPKSEQQGDFVSNDWHNCMGFFEHSGTVYIGLFKNGDYHGAGTIFYSTGDKYEGEFKFGTPFGRGVFTDPDGDVTPMCYGQIRSYGLYFCEPPAVLRAAFSNQSVIHRKRIQIKLREFGYEKEIDGLYGRGTAEALLVFNIQCRYYDLTNPENSDKLIEIIMAENGLRSDYQDIYEVASGVYNSALDHVCKSEKFVSSIK